LKVSGVTTDTFLDDKYNQTVIFIGKLCIIEYGQDAQNNTCDVGGGPWITAEDYAYLKFDKIRLDSNTWL
jgi:hypothetical protein